MIASIKSEFRKLLTVRSTYIILGFAMLLELLFSFYATGWRATGLDLASPNYVANQVISIIGPLTLFASIVAVLLITHEYRYNTIMYTLTSNRSRTSVLLSKIITISCFAIVFSLLFGFLSPVLGYAGIKLHGHTLSAQYISVWSVLWRTVFYGWGFAMLAAIMALIIRIQIGAVVALFLVPGPIEQIIGLLLKHNQIYLPFTALATLLGETSTIGKISYLKATTIVSAYIIIGLATAWYLFIKRDAS